jgi:cytochrome c-type biogenesis protein CcsB
MEIKTTSQMLPVYGAMLCYLIALVIIVKNLVSSGIAWMMGRLHPAAAHTGSRRLAAIFYFLGFAYAAGAFAVRWHKLDYLPLQSMFDIFLAMGVVIYPLTLLCRRLGASFESFDILLGFVLLFPAAFIFPSEPQKLPPALQSFLFGPHVIVYLLGYIIMAKAAVHALCHLTIGDRTQPRIRLMTATRREIKVSGTFIEQPKADGVSSDLIIFRLVALGFPFLTLGLILGSWWGQLAWGDYWGWDPKEMWSLATWLIFVLYFHIRYAYPARHKLHDVLTILGLAAIVITILWVNLSHIFPGLHSYAS